MRLVPTSTPEPDTAVHVRVPPLVIEAALPEYNVLHFDIETRKVGFHTGGRFSPDGCEPIAIAWSWSNVDIVEAYAQPEYDLTTMLSFFAEEYERASLVSGHYVWKFDLPIINGALMESGLSPLGEKLVSDTKCDLINRAGLSASQENLSAMYALEESKFHMNDHKWRQATRLTDDGLALTYARVTGDVRQHKALRKALLEHGFLGPPKKWRG